MSMSKAVSAYESVDAVSHANAKNTAPFFCNVDPENYN